MILAVALLALTLLAAAVPLLDRRLGQNTGYPLAVGYLAVGVVLAVAAPWERGHDTVALSWEWLPGLGVSAGLELDGLAAQFSMLTLGVGALIMAYCPRYLRPEDHHRQVYALLTLFAVAMLGLVMAADVILLVVFWELTTVCSFLLIASAGPHAVRPGVRAFLVTELGGLALLAAAVLLAVETGTTDLSTILDSRDQILGSALAWPIAALVLLAAVTKSAQFPLHGWLPGAMGAITPVSAYLHAATMVKAGIYLLMRFATLFSDERAWQVALIVIGLASAVYGALWALRQHDLKMMLAYSTVSQLGLLIAAVGVGTTTALAAAMLHTIAHALFKATLFMLVGIIDREAGSRDIRELPGLRRVMPVTAAVTGLAGLSMAGVPPLIGFVSKETLFEGYLEADVTPWAGTAVTAVAVLASTLTFAYGMRIFYGAFGGRPHQRALYEPAAAFLLPAAVPAVAGLVLGPTVAILDTVVGRSVLDVAPGSTPPHFVFWHGLKPELALTGVVIVAGLVVFRYQHRVERQLLRLPFTTALFPHGYNALLRAGAVVARRDREATATALLRRTLLGVAVLGAVGCAAALAGGGLPGPAPGTVHPLDWPLLVLLAGTVAGTVFARAALPALVMLSAAGLLVVVWFVLAGAPDVALTLLLAEVLTAVAAVRVLGGTPYRFGEARSPDQPGGSGPPAAADRRPGFGAPRRSPRTRARTVTDTALVAATGALAVLATLAFTGHRADRGPGGYVLDHAEGQTGGTNVVNTVLVDYRALDTLGEAVVLGAVALGLLTLLPRAVPGATRPFPATDGLVLGVAARILLPVAALVALALLLRGHYEPGGGFASALVAGTGLAFGALAAGRLPGAGRWLPRPAPTAACGVLLGVAVGLAPLAVGEPFLTPLRGTFALPGVTLSLTSSLLFDVGVWLLVIALVITAVDRLGSGLPEPPRPAAGLGGQPPVGGPATPRHLGGADADQPSGAAARGGDR